MASVTTLLTFILAISTLIIQKSETFAINNSFIEKHRNNSLRIIGGDAATDGQFPYETAIYVYTPDGSSFFCGGALIQSKWILTSGHCVYRGGDYTVCLGSKSLAGEDPLRVCIDANYSIAHPDYNPINFENDIGLIRIDTDYKPNVYIKTIQLSKQYLGNGVSVTVSGWGATADGDTITYNLRYADLKTTTNDDCQSYYVEPISNNLVCATGSNKGTCTGDSGSPLIAKDSFGIDVHLGVVTWPGADACQTRKPSLYTRTSIYYDWIESVIS